MEILRCKKKYNFFFVDFKNEKLSEYNNGFDDNRGNYQSANEHHWLYRYICFFEGVVKETHPVRLRFALFQRGGGSLRITHAITSRVAHDPLDWAFSDGKIYWPILRGALDSNEN